MAEQIKMDGIEEVEKPKATRAKKTTTATTPKKTTKKVEAETTEPKKATKTAAKSTKTAGAKAEAPKKTAKKVSKASVQEFLGTGKRKTSVARVRLSVGTGNFKVNGQDIKDYFSLETLRYVALQPLTLTELTNSVDVSVNVYGGGLSGQAGAVRHGVTRALLEFRPELRPVLKKAGFITRDARIKERKKYGLKKARKAPQFSKR